MEAQKRYEEHHDQEPPPGKFHSNYLGGDLLRQTELPERTHPAMQYTTSILPLAPKSTFPEHHVSRPSRRSRHSRVAYTAIAPRSSHLSTHPRCLGTSQSTSSTSDHSFEHDLYNRLSEWLDKYGGGDEGQTTSDRCFHGDRTSNQITKYICTSDIDWSERDRASDTWRGKTCGFKECREPIMTSETGHSRSLSGHPSFLACTTQYLSHNIVFLPVIELNGTPVPLFHESESLTVKE